MHYSFRHILALLLLFVALHLSAQSRDGVRKQMNQGRYDNAIILLTALQEIYSGQYDDDLRIAQKCLSLQNSAKSKYRNGDFTGAESLYNQILRLNREDSNARQCIKQCQRAQENALASEFEKCITIADYKSFAQHHPQYEAKAQERIAELETKADNERWTNAKNRNTIEYYEAYIAAKSSYSKHIYEAKQKIYPLYIARASNYYDRNDYVSAKRYYEKAKELFSLQEISLTKYKKCCEEIDFERISKSSFRFLTDLEGFLKKYPTSSHSSVIYGWIVEKKLKQGDFEGARAITDSKVVAYSDTFTPDAKWWKKHIKESQKQYKKNHKTSASYNSNRSPSSSRSYGVSRSSKNTYRKKSNTQFGVSSFIDVGFSNKEDLSYILSYGIGGELRLKEYNSRGNFVFGADLMRVQYNYFDHGSDYVTHLRVPAYFNYSIWNDPTGNMYLSAGAQFGIGLGGNNVSSFPIAALARWGVCSRHFDLNMYLIGYIVSPVTNGAGSPLVGVRMTYYF